MTDFLGTNIVDESPNVKCTWNMGSECSSNVAKRKMFSKQLEVPICDSHYEAHATVMVLNRAYKMNIESVVELSNEERAEQLKKFTDHSEVNASVMRQALDKLGQDVPDEEEKLVEAFADSFL